MTSDETPHNLTVPQAVERIQAAQGRAMHRLFQMDDVDSQECFELRGRIDALNSVVYLLKENPEPREWACDREHYRTLAQAGLQVSVELFKGHDGEDTDDKHRDAPADHNQEVY